MKPEFGAQARQPISVLHGVGPAIAGKLHDRGIDTLQDLWLQLPIAFEDRTQIITLDALQLGQTAQVEVRVASVERGFRFRPMLKVTVQDESLRQLSDDQLADLRAQRLGFVFQNFNLLKRMNVLENIALPLLYAGQSRKQLQNLHNNLHI